MRLNASSVKAKKLLKWQPKFKGKKGLIYGLKKTIKWYEENYDFINQNETHRPFIRAKNFSILADNKKKGFSLLNCKQLFFK